EAEATMSNYSLDAARIYWINATYLTEDSDALAAKAGTQGTQLAVRYALDAARLRAAGGLDSETARKLDILRSGLVLPAPTRAGAAEKLNEIATSLQSQYGKGKGLLLGN